MYDTLLAGFIAEELNKELRGAKIEKVSQPEQDEIVLQINAAGGRKKLLLSANPQGARVHYTARSYENPAQAPVFCMLLRKHLQGGRVISAGCVEGERIIYLDIESVGDMGFATSKRLIAETMGRHSNLILVDLAQGVIMDSIKRVPVDISAVRQILPGQPYVLPPSKPLQLYGALKEQYQSYGDALEAAKSPIPAVYYDAVGKMCDVHVIPLNYAEKREFESIGDALDYFYENKPETNRILQKQNELAKTVKALIEKQETKRGKLLNEIELSKESDIYRIKGELINANIHLIKPGAKSVELISFYDGNPVTIELDESKNAAKNAQQYFKKYSKLKSSAREKQAQLAECESELEYLKSQLGLIPGAGSHEDLELIRQELISQGHLRAKNVKDRKYAKALKPRPRRYTLANGMEVLVGRNNVENDYITMRLATKTDYWFHTKDIPGSHVVLLAGGEEPDADTIYETAAIAAYFSQAGTSENVPVDYVPARYVKKPAGAKPGKVIFTNNKTVWINPKAPN